MRSIYFCKIIVILFFLAPQTLEAQDILIPVGEDGSTVNLGANAPTDSFPGTARLRFSGGGMQSNCTGTLIEPRLILTARHCVLRNDTGDTIWSNVVVSLRVHRNCNKVSVSVAMSSTTVYFDTKPGTSHQIFEGKDRALILLPKEVECAKERIAPLVSLNDKGLLYVAAWGYTLETSSGIPNELIYVRSENLTLHGNISDKSYQLTSDLADASGKTVESPVCHGDSGGPVYLGPKDKNLEQVKLAGIIAGYLPGPGTHETSPTKIAAHCAKQKKSVITGMKDLASWVLSGKTALGL